MGDFDRGLLQLAGFRMGLLEKIGGLFEKQAIDWSSLALGAGVGVPLGALGYHYLADRGKTPGLTPETQPMAQPETSPYVAEQDQEAQLTPEQYQYLMALQQSPYAQAYNQYYG